VCGTAAKKVLERSNVNIRIKLKWVKRYEIKKYRSVEISKSIFITDDAMSIKYRVDFGL
jgi:hypothetical protein